MPSSRKNQVLQLGCCLVRRRRAAVTHRPERIGAIRLRQGGTWDIARASGLGEFQNVPTLKEQGTNYTAYQWRGIMVKAGTPMVIVSKLSAVFKEARTTKQWKDYLAKVSQDDGYEGPEAFAKTYREALQQMDEVKKGLGL